LVLLLEALRQPGEECAARTELRRTDTDAGTVADLIFQIEQIDGVESTRMARCLSLTAARRSSRPRQLDTGVPFID